ncbi:hypothetical protein BX666DRAFT_611919 [Dichotomocladium elegans]|nr:hypothetical protein BX666DRAFT_611919 [Dichotomocladium elegans]
MEPDAIDPKFLIHQTSHMYITEPIFFQAVQLDKSVFIWAGKQEANLKNLSIAMPSLINQIPPSTTVLGQDVSEQSRNLARRLAAKYGLQFFVSLNIGNQDEMLVAFTEKKITEFIKGIFG